MSKSKNRRKRTAAVEPSNMASTLQDDLSIVAEGDKVVPNPVLSDAIPLEKEAPRLGVTYSRDTGQPIVTVASPAEQRAPEGAASGTLESAMEDRPAYGPDGSIAEKKMIKGSGTEIHSPDIVDQDGATKDELRHIAKAVALSPEPEESTLKSVLNQFRSVLNRGAAICQDVWAATKRFLAKHDIHKPQDVGRQLAAKQERLAQVAFALRIGLGALFTIGGLSKLSQLLSPTASDAMVASYTSTTGYINEFFMAFLFAPGTSFNFTPWAFLTTLSAFEFITGIMLLAGLLVRPVALIYAFLLWTFVIALPVVTTNGIDPGVKTYMAPAILVQIRDIALSGMMFALYGLGAGVRSIDYKLFGPKAIEPVITSETAGLLLRLSAAVVLLVGGVFAGMPNIKTYIEPGLLLVIVALAILWGGRITRYAAGVACAVLFVYMLGKLGLDKSLIGNLNAIKRELALFAGAFVLAARDCGQLWTAKDVAQRLQDGTECAMQNVARPRGTLEPAD